MNRLQGKVAVVTGAAGGIGAAAARLLAEEGAKVLLVDLAKSALEVASNEIPGETSWIAADVADQEQTAGFMATAVERYGRLDIALLNAGIEGAVAPIHQHRVEDFDRVMSVNVRGVWLGVKYAVAAMLESGGGSIVITSSVAGLSGVEGMSGYSASKHAVVGIMRTAAIEYAKHNIRVNTVHPAPIDTQMMRAVEAGFIPDKPEAAKGAMEKMIPLKRYGTPAEVAKLMLFLASDDSSFCTGGTYTVDGGMSAG